MAVENKVRKVWLCLQWAETETGEKFKEHYRIFFLSRCPYSDTYLSSTGTIHNHYNQKNAQGNDNPNHVDVCPEQFDRFFPAHQMQPGDKPRRILISLV